MFVLFNVFVVLSYVCLYGKRLHISPCIYSRLGVILSFTNGAVLRPGGAPAYQARKKLQL